MLEAALRLVRDGGSPSLRLKVINVTKQEHAEVVNITVNSPDHSYVLANGLNNFNCASFESVSGRVYYSFDRRTHVSDKVKFNPHLPIWVGMDFNIDPMSMAIIQEQEDGSLWIVDEIVQFNSNVDDAAAELARRYWRYMNQITIYPDPAAKSRQHARGESSLDILREHGFKYIKYRRKHPAIDDRINCVNRQLMSASGSVGVLVAPHCKQVIRSFEQTMYKEGSRDINKQMSVEHVTDAIGYCFEYERPMRKVKIHGISI